MDKRISGENIIQDIEEKEHKRKERNRLYCRRYRERQKEKAAKEAQERKEKKRIYNKHYQDKVKKAAAKAVKLQETIEDLKRSRAPARRMTSRTSSPMDLGSPTTTSSANGQQQVLLVPYTNPRHANSSSTACSQNGATQSVTLAAEPCVDMAVTRTMTTRSMMAASPIVKLVKEIEHPSQEHVEVYKHALNSFKKNLETEMRIEEEAYQSYTKIARETFKNDNDISKADRERNKEFSVTENQRIKEYHDYRKNALAEVAEMEQLMVLTMLKKATPVKIGTDDNNVENVSTNVVMSTPKHSGLKKNEDNNGRPIAGMVQMMTPPPASTFSFSNNTTSPASMLNLPNGNFSIGKGSDKKPPSKYRVKPKTRTPIRSSIPKNAKCSKYLKNPKP
jgi:hypothetical protein